MVDLRVLGRDARGTVEEVVADRFALSSSEEELDDRGLTLTRILVDLLESLAPGGLLGLSLMLVSVLTPSRDWSAMAAVCFSRPSSF
jgi:hypothetical protein